MDWGFRRFFCLFALQSFLFIQCVPSADATVGVCVGYNEASPPLPSQIVSLLTNNFVTQIRIFDTNAEILKAFINSNVQVIVGVTNAELATVGASNVSAASWVTTNIIPFAQSVNITAIAVGDDVFVSDPGFAANLAQTMTWIYAALTTNGLDTTISVSTPLSIGVLQNSFPPSKSLFNQSMLPNITPVLQFINLTGSYVMLNVDTFGVFQSNLAALSLGYALFQPGIPTTDSYSGFSYYSLFDALLDATYYALDSQGFTNVRIVVSATGWPSDGDSNESGANVTNAQTYNSNLVAHVNNKSGIGTPSKPLVPITAFVYELLNEDLDLGATSNRYYGLFSTNLTPVYNVDLTGQGRLLTSNGTQYQTWCVANQDATPQGLQSGLDWACSAGLVNCSATLPGGVCFNPNTALSHASWVFNAYYQMVGNAPNSCNFNGAAEIVAFNPSYGSCVFQGSNVTTTVPGGPTPPTSPNSATSAKIETAVLGGCLMVLFILTFRHLNDIRG